jgi:hypothetical protein
MRNRVSEYLCAVVGHWKTVMTGVLGLLTSWIAAARESNHLFIALSGVAGLFALFVAGYKAWKDEVVKYEAELARNSVADFRGHIDGVSVNRTGENKSELCVVFQLQNLSSADAMLKRIIFTVADRAGNVSNSEIHRSEKYMKILFRRGEVHDGWHKFGVNIAEDQVFQPSLTMRIIDAFDGEVILRMNHSVEKVKDGTAPLRHSSKVAR